MASNFPAYFISCTAKTIGSLYDLQPGDHIRVKGDLCNSGKTFYTHHMLVVNVLSDSMISVIHKIGTVIEEVKCYRPEDIEVLDYECQYTGLAAIMRARARACVGEDYNIFLNNCEHFVTEVKTGVALSVQVYNTVVTGAGIALGVALFVATAAGWVKLLFPKQKQGE